MEAYANRLIRKWKRGNPENVVKEFFEPGSTGNKGAEIHAKSFTEALENQSSDNSGNSIMFDFQTIWSNPVNNSTSNSTSNFTSNINNTTNEFT